MLCEECQKNEANFTVSVMSEGESRTRHLCADCFSRMNAGLRSTVAGVVMEFCQDKRFADVSIYADNDPSE